MYADEASVGGKGGRGRKREERERDLGIVIDQSIKMLIQCVSTVKRLHAGFIREGTEIKWSKL